MSDQANGAAALPDHTELLRLRRGARPTLSEWLLAMLPWAGIQCVLAALAMFVASGFGGLYAPRLSALALTALALIFTVVLPWRAYARARQGDDLAMPSLLLTTSGYVAAAMMVFVR